MGGKADLQVAQELQDQFDLENQPPIMLPVENNVVYDDDQQFQNQQFPNQCEIYIVQVQWKGKNALEKTGRKLKWDNSEEHDTWRRKEQKGGLFSKAKAEFV